MPIAHILYALGGAAAAGIVGSLGKGGLVHRSAVMVTAAGLRVADAVNTTVQSIVDEAADVNAEAQRQCKIDVAVADRLAELEEGIRTEVTAKIDAEQA